MLLRIIISMVGFFIVWVLAFMLSCDIAWRIDPPFTKEGHHPVMPTEQLFFSFLISLIVAIIALYYISINSRKIKDWIIDGKN